MIWWSEFVDGGEIYQMMILDKSVINLAMRSVKGGQILQGMNSDNSGINFAVR